MNTAYCKSIKCKRLFVWIEGLTEKGHYCSGDCQNDYQRTGTICKARCELRRSREFNQLRHIDNTFHLYREFAID